ncbi:MAG: WbqC family protein [Bacteroidales bacterium]|nr:WbqC family protein [Bacteroidales bacterium]
MKLGIMQPYFLPYIGYWQLLAAVDKYVVYDDVNYIKGGWINRNNFLVQEQKKLVTFSLNGASPNKIINSLSIKDNFASFIGLLNCNYKKAPYFKDIMSLVTNIISFDKSKLSLFLYNSIKEIAHYLDINTELILSSDLKKDNSLKGQDKIIHMCKLLKANEYYNAIGGQKLYNSTIFEKNNIKLIFVQPLLKPYKQFKNDFIGGLSILDVLMFNTKEEVKKMLQDYKLI